jgi:hypothetical protein
VTITGQNTHFAHGTSQVSLGAGITVASVSVSSPTSLTAQISINQAAAVGAPSILVETGAELAFLTNGFTVTTPTLLSLSSNSGQQNLSVAITGQFTHISQGTSQVSFGSDITVNSVAVASATSLTANITIPLSANLGAHSVTVSTGSEVATLANGFTVQAGTPVITQVNPNTGQQGQANLSVIITGQFTHWVQGTTTASFDAGITVASLTVNSATSATAVLNIDPGTATGTRPVTLTTGSETANVSNGFTVLIATMWLPLSQVNVPSPTIGGPGIVYNSTTKRMIFFGGATLALGVTNETWVVSNADGLNGTPTWNLLPTNSTLPPARFGQAQVYDSAHNILTIFGGTPEGVFFNDVWVLANADGTTGQGLWQQLNPTSTPPSPRRYSSAVYDPSTNRMIIFGGCLCVGDETASWLSDVWVLTNANGTEPAQPSWIELAPNPPLPPGHPPTSAAYDPQTNRLIIFGGGNGRPRIQMTFGSLSMPTDWEARRLGSL